MSALEDQADDGKARALHWKPMSWLGTLRPTSVDDAWAPAIWQTFLLSSLPRHHLPAAKCGCKKVLAHLSSCSMFDHISTCTAHSGATKAHDWMVGRLGPLLPREVRPRAGGAGPRQHRAGAAPCPAAARSRPTLVPAGSGRRAACAPPTPPAGLGARHLRVRRNARATAFWAHAGRRPPQILAARGRPSRWRGRPRVKVARGSTIPRGAFPRRTPNSAELRPPTPRPELRGPNHAHAKERRRIRRRRRRRKAYSKLTQ